MFNIKRHNKSYSLYINGELRSCECKRNREQIQILEKEINSHILDLLEGGVILVRTYEKRTKSTEYIDSLNSIYSIILDDNNGGIIVYTSPFMLEYKAKNYFIFALKDDIIDESIRNKTNISARLRSNLDNKDIAIYNTKMKLSEICSVKTVNEA